MYGTGKSLSTLSRCSTRQQVFQVYHFLPNLPEVGDGVGEGGRDGEGAEEQVGEGQVDQEDVSRGPHHLWSHKEKSKKLFIGTESQVSEKP